MQDDPDRRSSQDTADPSAPGQCFPKSLAVFSTCPPSSTADAGAYRQRVIEAARWSDRRGCDGILVYTDNSLIDPWLIAQIIIEHTERLCPLVAVQPAYMHPYAVAKLVASLGYLYGRRIHLNMVAGGFRNDLSALNDKTAHDRRYDRLREYTLIVKRLLAGDSQVTLDGEFYKVDKLKLTPALPAELVPKIFVSGSSAAGLAAAQAIGAIAVEYPKAPEEYSHDVPGRGDGIGVRVGLIARESSSSAWELAHRRFPEDRRGQVTHQLAMKISDSEWHKHLSQTRISELSPYWLVPFQSYKTFCPYLVGDYGRVAEELGRYIGAGATTFILDVPISDDDLGHSVIAFHRALQSIS